VAADSMVLQVVVGHGLRRYFLNAVRSVRAVAPGDPFLVIDNASPDPVLKEELAMIAAGDPSVEVVFREENDLGANSKVGSLYAAYELAFDHASRHGFGFVHLVQADTQLMWWDEEVVARARALYERHPSCVNIVTTALPRDKLLTDQLTSSPVDGVLLLRRYGLTDMGLFHLLRWREHGLSFGPTERAHSDRALRLGLEAVLHPWPTDAQVPWPAAIRKGRQRGREPHTSKPFLLKALSPAQILQLKGLERQPWLEDIAVPWGWACLSPYWTTDVDSVDYWVLRYRDALQNGLSHLVPRVELRGVFDPGSLRPNGFDFRPSLWRLCVTEPARELGRRAAAWVGRGTFATG
jgi:hypothetical protein